MTDNDLRMHFAQAMNEWAEHTCLEFLALPSADYMNLTDKFRSVMKSLKNEIVLTPGVAAWF